MKTFDLLSRAVGMTLTALILSTSPALSAQTISGKKAGIVEVGANGKTVSIFRQTGIDRKSKRITWGEFKVGNTSKNADANYEELSRDDQAIVLYNKRADVTVVLDLAAETGSIGQGQDPEELEYAFDIIRAKSAPSSVQLASSKAGTEFDQFIRGLQYDPVTIMVKPKLGSEVNDPSKDDEADGKPRVTSRDGSRVTVTTKTLRSAGGPVDQYTLLNPATDVIYPGSIITANGSTLGAGQAKPVTGKKAPITISVDLPGANLLKTIETPAKSTVEAAINEILIDYQREQGEKVQNASSALLSTKVYSREQAAASLNVAVDWAGTATKAKLNVSNDAEKEVIVAFFKQKYYTVSVDVPESPGAVFSQDIPIEDLQTQLDETNPPGYISSIDYGRLVMVRMETDKSNLKVNAQAAFEKGMENSAADDEAKSEGQGTADNPDQADSADNSDQADSADNSDQADSADNTGEADQQDNAATTDTGDGADKTSKNDKKGGNKIRIRASGDYEAVLRNSTFTAVVLGGSAKGAAEFNGNLEGLQRFIEAGAVFDERNPGAPIAYTVRFLKDNKIASVNLTTDYIQTETNYVEDGYIDIYNGCTCTIGVEVSYSITGEESKLRWSDDNIKLAGTRYVELPGDARGVKMKLYRYNALGDPQTTYVVPGLQTTPKGAPKLCISPVQASTYFDTITNVKPGRCNDTE